MTLYYINPGDCSVVEAQVFSLLEYFQNHKKFSNVILLQGYRNLQEKMKLQAKLGNRGVTVIWFKVYYDYPLFVNLTHLSLSRVLASLKFTSDTIVHIRGDLYGFLAMKYFRARGINQKILIDIRGLVLDEIDAYLENRVLRNIKKNLFKKVYKKIRDGVNISVVSKAFKEYLIMNQGFNPKYLTVNSNITSTIFDFDNESRKRIRQELSIPEDSLVAICSSGGGETWQKDFKVIKTLLDLNIVVINLSSKSVNIEGVINKSVPFHSVPKYLSAADLGILWRDQTSFNWVASPSKFSEFVSSGLFVIHNETIDLVVDYLQEYNAGVNVKEASDISKIPLIGFTIEERRDKANIGQSVFGIHTIGTQYIRNYERMVN